VYFCENCQKIIELTGIKYCPYCGNDNIKTFSLAKVLPQDKLVFVVKYAKGKIATEVITRMQESLDYFEIGVGKIKYCCTPYTKSNIVELYKLIHNAPIRLQYLLFDLGRKVKSVQFIYDAALCIMNRESSGIGKAYCFGHDGYANIVGCRNVNLELPSYQWLHFPGTYLDVFGNYKYDKSNWLSYIERAEKIYRYCPYFDASASKRFVNAWPEIINIYTDKRFRQVPPKYYDASNIKVSPFRDDGNLDRQSPQRRAVCQTPAKFMPPVPVDIDFLANIARLTYPVVPDPETIALIEYSILKATTTFMQLDDTI